MNKDVSKDLLPIENLPHLPDEVIDAYENNRLVLFIGAGISRLMGCQGWEDMANSLIRQCCDASQAEQIIKSPLGSKEKITIAKRISLQEESKEKAFWKTFKQAVNPQEPSNIDIYTPIASLNIPIITTNCDHYLIKHFPGRYTTDCTVDEYNHHEDEPYVYCIHGLYGDSEKDKSTLVFTVDQYLFRYSNRSPLQSFLMYIFETKTVLFLGCGLSEFEILSAVFQPRPQDETIVKSHFALEGFFLYQEQYYEAIAFYYDSVGIKLIPYSKEKNGYSQQIEIIKNWINELAQKSSFYSRGIDEIDKALDVFDNVSQEKLKVNLSHSIERNRVFLKSVLELLPRKSEGLQWLCFLIKNRFISSEKLLGAQQEKSRYLQHSDILSTISDCLDQFKPKEVEKDIFREFIKQSIQTTALDKSLLTNFLVTEDLASICIKLNMIPSDQESWLVFSEWSKRAHDSGYRILNRYVGLIHNWDSDTLIRLFCNIFMPTKDGAQSRKGYWFEHTAQLIANKFSDKKFIITSIINKCLQYYFEAEDENDFYQCFADRYQTGSHDYGFSLIKSIEILFNVLSKTQKKNILKSQLKNANKSIKYQTLLYLARVSVCYDFNIFANNPLNETNTFVDFYLWLNDIIDNQITIASSKIEVLGHWIDSATFGIAEIGSLDSEFNNRILTKINTQKYQLFELISKITNNYQDQLEYYKNQKRYTLKTPTEDIKSYYTFRKLDNIKHLPSRIDPALSVPELVKIVNDGIISSKLPKGIYDYSDGYLELFGKISRKQLQAMFEYGLTLPCKEFIHMTFALYYEKLVKQFSKKYYRKLIKDIVSKLVDENPDQKLKQIFLRQICESLKLLKRIGWKNQEVFEFGIEIECEQFFLSEDGFSYDKNLLSNIFGSVESSYYMLIIETAYECSDRSISKKCIDWLSKNISKHFSEQLLSVLSYYISYLMFIDKTWTENSVLTAISVSEHKAFFALCMCCSPGYIYKSVITFITDNNLIEEIADLIKVPEPNSENANAVINYIVAGYYFKYLDYDHYKIFISCLAENNTNHLIWSCLQGINTGEYEKEKMLLEETYDIYCETHEDVSIHSAVLNYISRFGQLDADCWSIIKTAVDQNTHNSNLWIDIRDCLEMTIEANDDIDAVISIALNTDIEPELFVLKNVMYLLAKIDKLNMVKTIARYAMNNSLDVTEMSKYYSKPEIILKCSDSETYDAGWVGLKNSTCTAG